MSVSICTAGKCVRFVIQFIFCTLTMQSSITCVFSIDRLHLRYPRHLLVVYVSSIFKDVDASHLGTQTPTREIV